MVGDKTALLSREGTVHSYLIELDEDHYQWCTDGETPYRVSYDKRDENEIAFLDPADGGPLFGIGYRLDTRVVVRIRREDGKYIVTMK